MFSLRKSFFLLLCKHVYYLNYQFTHYFWFHVNNSNKKNKYKKTILIQNIETWKMSISNNEIFADIEHLNQKENLCNEIKNILDMNLWIQRQQKWENQILQLYTTFAVTFHLHTILWQYIPFHLYQADSKKHFHNGFLVLKIKFEIIEVAFFQHLCT